MFSKFKLNNSNGSNSYGDKSKKTFAQTSKNKGFKKSSEVTELGEDEKKPFNRFNKEIIYDFDKLFRYGLNRLSERDCCRSELKKKMARYQTDMDMIDKALDLLESKGYLSDYRRARGIYNQYSAKESISKIKQRIMQKGVNKDALDILLGELESERADSIEEEKPEVMQCTALIKQKFKSFDKEKKDKMVRFLASKGFKYNDISKAIGLFSEEEE